MEALTESGGVVACCVCKCKRNRFLNLLSPLLAVFMAHSFLRQWERNIYGHCDGPVQWCERDGWAIRW